MDLPSGKAILMCDQVIEDAVTHKKTLVGTFNIIYAEDFPCIHQRLSVFASLQNGRGKMTVSLKLRRVGDEEIILQIDGNVAFDNPTQVIDLVYNIQKIPFAQAGTHAFEIYAEGNLISDSRFELAKT
jgi:hypothetical protein